ISLSLLNELHNRIVIGDGAMGTILYAHGVDSSFEALNLTHPDQIRNVHEAYIHAGAEVIQTNTYGANYIKLARYGLAEQVKKSIRKPYRLRNKQARTKRMLSVISVVFMAGLIIPNQKKKLSEVFGNNFTVC